MKSLNLRYSQIETQWACWDNNRSDLKYPTGKNRKIPKNPDGVGDTWAEAVGAAVALLQQEAEGWGDAYLTIESIRRVDSDIVDTVKPEAKTKPGIDEFIPEGYEFVRVGPAKQGEHYIKTEKLVVKAGNSSTSTVQIIVKPCDPKPYRVEWISFRDVEAHSALGAAIKVKKAVDAITCVFEVSEPGKPTVRVDVREPVHKAKESCGGLEDE